MQFLSERYMQKLSHWLSLDVGLEATCPHVFCMRKWRRIHSEALGNTARMIKKKKKNMSKRFCDV